MERVPAGRIARWKTLNARFVDNIGLAIVGTRVGHVSVATLRSISLFHARISNVDARHFSISATTCAVCPAAPVIQPSNALLP